MSGEKFHNPYFDRQTEIKTKQRGNLLAGLGCLVLSIILLWYIFGYLGVLSVKQISVEGQQYLTAEQISQVTEAALTQRRWLVFPQSFLPVLQPTTVAETITAQLANTLQLESVEVVKHWPNRLTVRVVERVPGFVYMNGKQAYYLDVQGVITAETSEAEADPHFPHIRERNKKRVVAVGDHVLQPGVLEFIGQLHEDFTPRTDLDISEYAILPITCQEKQFVTEKIFADEIEGSTSETTKEKKRAVLDQLRDGLISVDESLELLQEIKHSEGGESDGGNEAFLQWQTEYTEVDCDYEAVIRDVAIVTQQGPDIYFDSGLELPIQLDHLSAVLLNDIADPADLKYIDVRYNDRVYYQ